MKILHTADWHVGRTIRGKDRSHEHEQVLAEITDLAVKEQVDLVILAGDIFDAAAPPPEAERIVYRSLLDLAAVAPVVAIAGNHDHPRRLEAIAPLLELGRVTVAGLVHPPDQGGLLQIKTEHGEPVFIALLPFVAQRYLVRFDQLMKDEKFQHDVAYSERIGRLIGELCAPIPTDVIGILTSHLMVVGGTLGGGERSAHTVFDYAVPATHFPGSLHYVALGHLHRRQRVPAAAPAWYAGSPLQLDFGEEKDEKGVLLIEAVPQQPAMVREVNLKGGLRLRTLRGTFEQLVAMVDQQDDAHLRIVVEDSVRPGLNDEVRSLFPNAVEVKISQEPAGQAAAKPVRIGRPPGELFAEYLDHQGEKDSRLLALFQDLVEEADATDTS